MVRGHPPPRWPIVSRGDTRRCVSWARALAWLWACVWTHAATSAPRRFSLLITRVPALMFAVTSWKVLWWQPRTNSCQGNGLLCHCVQPHRQKFTDRTPSTTPTVATMPLPERNLTRLDLAQTSYSTNNQSARLNFFWNRSSLLLLLFLEYSISYSIPRLWMISMRYHYCETRRYLYRLPYRRLRIYIWERRDKSFRQMRQRE